MRANVVPRTMHDLFEGHYVQLHRVATARFAGEHGYRTIQPTSLIHEVFVRLSGRDPRGFDDPGVFMAVASRTMREVLIDHARQRKRLKRGRLWRRISLHRTDAAAGSQGERTLELHEALLQLSKSHERPAQIAEFFLFGGFSLAEISRMLGLSLRTVQLDWSFARASLKSMIM